MSAALTKNKIILFGLGHIFRLAPNFILLS